MKPRPFRLDRLLKVRELRQKQAQQRLGTAARAVQRQEEAVAALVDQRLAVRAGLQEREGRPAGVSAPLDVEAAVRGRTAMVQLARQAGQAAVALTPLSERMNVRRQELVTARRASRVLENLRDRRERALRRWRAKREQRTLDDLANGRAAVERRASRGAQGGGDDG